MAYTHVAHDCRIGDTIILANAASLGGHVHIGDWAILGGFSIVHQFCRHRSALLHRMGSVISKDVPPYVMAAGHPRDRTASTAKDCSDAASPLSRLPIKRAYKTL